ncbi:uncharacterized protein G2W53_013490 [Senna tora]|uniref:Uncharacterized protein n=1 Tax=Senna tora TaxID=362788 RepID=A0A834WQM9_9FABA|nr:uncharacterized protein G2W53_013490 [Senna tora]
MGEANPNPFPHTTTLLRDCLLHLSITYLPLLLT